MLNVVVKCCHLEIIPNTSATQDFIRKHLPKTNKQSSAIIIKIPPRYLISSNRDFWSF